MGDPGYNENRYRFANMHLTEERMTLLFQTGSKSDAFRIRQAVFVEEQGFREEFDDVDEQAATIHMTAHLEGEPVGCSRFFPDPEDDECWVIGRLAVLPRFRGEGIGSELVKESERLAKERGASCTRLHAQCRAVPFYEKLGYEAYGEVEMDEHVEHVWMRKQIKQ